MYAGVEYKKENYAHNHFITGGGVVKMEFSGVKHIFGNRI